MKSNLAVLQQQKKCHNTRHKDIQHDDTQHNDTQHNVLICDTQHNIFECHYAECRSFYCCAECCYAEWRQAEYHGATKNEEMKMTLNYEILKQQKNGLVSRNQGTLTEGEGSVQLTSLY